VGVVHKKRAGALRLDLSGEERVRETYDTVTELFQEDLRGIVVQAMAPRRFEVLLGVAQQPVFGPLVVCGLGGTYTEALRTRSARLAPLTDLDAAELVRSVRVIRELGEQSGEDSVDPTALADMALRLSWLTEDLEFRRSLHQDLPRRLGYGFAVIRGVVEVHLERPDAPRHAGTTGRARDEHPFVHHRTSLLFEE
jgi:hypothetical protein